MEMSQYFTTELGRMRTEEMIARADRYRLAQQAKQRKQARKSEDRQSSRTELFAFRRALTAVGLSVLMVVMVAGVALARPTGPGDGPQVAAPVTDQVKGERPGVEVPLSEAQKFVNRYGYYAGAGGVVEPQPTEAEKFVARYGYYAGAGGVVERDPVAPVTERSVDPESELPLAAIAVVATLLILVAGAAMVVTRSQQSPTTV